MVRRLGRAVNVGVETADMLVQELFSREIRDRRALARSAPGLGSCLSHDANCQIKC
jgi:transposase